MILTPYKTTDESKINVEDNSFSDLNAILRRSDL